MTDDFAPFKALSFDCYGTLIDWERGITQALRPWAARHGLRLSDHRLLTAFSSHETVVQAERPTAPYPEVLSEVLKRIGERFGVGVSPIEARSFGATVGDWPAFPDTSDALRRLGTRFELLILSNVDKASFRRSNRHLGVMFDRVITAEDVGSYKPDPANFAALLAQVEELGLTSDQLLHVAESLHHDHQPAQAAGLSTVWIHRRHGKDGYGAAPQPQGDATWNWRFTSLAAFADAAGV